MIFIDNEGCLFINIIRTDIFPVYLSRRYSILWIFFFTCIFPVYENGKTMRTKPTINSKYGTKRGVIWLRSTYLLE